MQQENNITLRGVVTKVNLDTRTNGKHVLMVDLMTKYIYKAGDRMIEEIKYTPCKVYESKENKQTILGVEKGSIITINGRLADIDKGSWKQTIVVAEKIVLHKMVSINAKTDM